MDGPQIVLYDYRPGRRAEYCGDFLSSFSGTITTDGYEAYHKLARENALRFKAAG
jgi:transposase